MRTPQFALLWLMYACSAFAGLMIIGHMAKIAALQMSGLDLGFLLVAVLAIGNALGRVVAGVVSDRIGGIRTMLIVFVAQAAMMGAAGVLAHRRHARSRRGGCRLLLRREPVAVPLDDGRLLRHQEPGRQLRPRLHGVGCGRRVRVDGRGFDRRLGRQLRRRLRDRCRSVCARRRSDVRHEAAGTAGGRGSREPRRFAPRRSGLRPPGSQRARSSSAASVAATGDLARWKWRVGSLDEPHVAVGDDGDGHEPGQQRPGPSRRPSAAAHRRRTGPGCA